MPHPAISTADQRLLAEAVGLHRAGRLDEAARAYEAVLRRSAAHPDVLHLLGLVRQQQGRHEEAVGLIAQALQLDPRLAQAHYNMGLSLSRLRRYDESIASYRLALAANPNSPEAHNNLGLDLLLQDEPHAAVDHFRQAIALNPGFAKAHYNLGTALRKLRRLEEALASYDRAIALEPGYCAAHYTRAMTLEDLTRPLDALESFRRAVDIDPYHAQALSLYVHLKRQLCDWSRLKELEVRLIEGVRQNQLIADPMAFLYSSFDAADQQINARRFTATYLPLPPRPLVPAADREAGRIRVGYLSADFREHVMAYQTVELFELHDRSRFEVIGISCGPRDESAIGRRVRKAFDHFVDAERASDQDLAQRVAALKVHIAVDLNGHTRLGRTRILAWRPAPIQAQYLGYPSTFGANYIDYLLVDDYLVPADQRHCYDEKLVYLPHSFMVSDRKRRIATRPTRVQCGLPEPGFVFCSFNNLKKLSPKVFDIWMRLIEQIPGSVLWLAAEKQLTAANLRREAAARGVAPERLIFAPWTSHDRYLAQFALADLFLDTLPYNAHGTASDALFMGVPVLTCSGTALAGRVAGSLLQALGLAELATASLDEYQALALELARSPSRLAHCKAKLARQRDQAPLFDTAGFARNLERAYGRMIEIWREGKEPEGFAVEPVT